MRKETSSPKAFFEEAGLSKEAVSGIVQEGLKGADYGELYQEATRSEKLVKDKGVYTQISIGNGTAGFGFRVGQKERVGYSYSAEFNEKALKAAVSRARQVLNKKEVQAPQPAYGKTKSEMYPALDPAKGMTIEEKISALDEVENYIRKLDPAISNVTLQYAANDKSISIVTPDGRNLTDQKPMTTLGIWVTVTDSKGNSETGSGVVGGSVSCEELFKPEAYQAAAQKALKEAKTLLVATAAPAGIMDIVMSPGWGGVLLHEAVGHGLEGDFNRREISVYSKKIGQKIATDEVTVIDQGDIAGARGSLHFDDEGTPTQKNVLIENGVLKAYMQDRQNAQLMGAPLTGNGRRQNYTFVPIPRMTNTFFAAGKHKPEDIIASVKDGLYAAVMGGGQVDITSGKFNMNATLAYRIRNGKLAEPVKGAALVGDGLSVIQSITMVGDDLRLEKSSGVCGKNGQGVPVGVGQPTVRISNMTIGGTKK